MSRRGGQNLRNTSNTGTHGWIACLIFIPRMSQKLGQKSCLIKQVEIMIASQDLHQHSSHTVCVLPIQFKQVKLQLSRELKAFHLTATSVTEGLSKTPYLALSLSIQWLDTQCPSSSVISLCYDGMLSLINFHF